MAFDKTPTAWLSGYTSDGSDISLPIADIDELTADEANQSTGDIREIVFALIEKLYQAQQEQDETNRPANMRISRAKSFDQNGNENRSYTFGFTLISSGVNVKDES